MINALKTTANSTDFDLQALAVAKKRFYQGRKPYSLKTSFELLQNVVYYGEAVLAKNAQHIKDILEMCVLSIQQLTANNLPRTESEFCEGVFLMQSLMLAEANLFSLEMWSVCLQCLASKLEGSPIAFDFLKSSIITTTTLILSCAYPLLSPAQQSHILGLALL
jgi:hypothetical protein